MTTIVWYKDNNDNVRIAADWKWNFWAITASEEPKIFNPEWSNYFIWISGNKYYYDILKAYQSDILPKSFDGHKSFLEFYKKFKKVLQDFSVDGNKWDDWYMIDANIIIATPTSIHRMSSTPNVESKNSKYSIITGWIWWDFINWYLCWAKEKIIAEWTYPHMKKWLEAVNTFDITTWTRFYIYNVTDLHGEKTNQLTH